MVTGMLMTLLEVVLSPPFIKIVGIGTWQRLGFIVGVPAIVAVPAVKLLSWNYPSLFVVSVIVNTLALCALGAVSEPTELSVKKRQVVRGILQPFPPSHPLSRHTWHSERCKQGLG